MRSNLALLTHLKINLQKYMLNWTNVIKTDPNAEQYIIPKNWLSIHYYEALTILFRVENALRIFVYIIIKNKYQKQWTNRIVNNTNKTISEVANERIQNDEDFGHLGYKTSCPIMHLTMGELLYVIFKDWKTFEYHFPGKKDIMNNKLYEINNIRNAVAHFRPIHKDDINALKTNVKHTLMKIDNYISDLLACFSFVPPNTEDEWYKRFEHLENYCSTNYKEHNSFYMLEDKNEKWISLVFPYDCLTINSFNLELGQRYFQLTNLNSSKILQQIPRIVKHVTFISEDCHGNPLTSDSAVFQSGLKSPYTKRLRLFFRKKIIQSQFKDIYHDLYKIAKIISDESNIVLKDPNNRGELVFGTQIFIQKTTLPNNQAQWTMNADQLLTEVKSEDPPEFWGNFDLISDFITNTHKYPWMPPEVSQRGF